jgi:hypothetical protein
VAAYRGEVAQASGRLTLNLPRSLHAALKREAASEGVSLNELIRLKLGLVYRDALQALMASQPPSRRSGSEPVRRAG